MKIRMQNKAAILFAALLLAFSGCKTTKESATGSLAGLNATEVFSSILDRSLRYETLSGKLNVSFKTQKKSIASNASIRIIKDRRIQLSFQPFLGIEAFRFDLTPDSIVVVDRLNKYYVAESFSEINKNKGLSLDFNFSNLQALLTNRLFLAGQNNVSSGDKEFFTIEVSNDKALLKTEDRQGIRYLFTGNPAFQITALQMSAKQKNQAVAFSSEYDNFQSVSALYTFPMFMGAKLTTPSKENYELELKYSKVELDKDLNTDTSIPNKYQRIRLDEALKIIQKI